MCINRGTTLPLGLGWQQGEAPHIQQPGVKASGFGQSLCSLAWHLMGGKAEADWPGPAAALPPAAARSSPGPHQHVLRQPALIPGQPRGDAKGKALLAQQRVATIAAAEGDDLPLVRHVANQGFLWIAWPLAHRLPWGQWGHGDAGRGIRNWGVRGGRDQGVAGETLGNSGANGWLKPLPPHNIH